MCGKLYYKRYIVRLNICIVCRLVSHKLSAPLAFVDYYIAFSRVGYRRNGCELAKAVIRTVARVYIYVERVKTKRTMVA